MSTAKFCPVKDGFLSKPRAAFKIADLMAWRVIVATRCSEDSLAQLNHAAGHGVPAPEEYCAF